MLGCARAATERRRGRWLAPPEEPGRRAGSGGGARRCSGSPLRSESGVSPTTDGMFWPCRVERWATPDRSQGRVEPEPAPDHGADGTLLPSDSTPAVSLEVLGTRKRYPAAVGVPSPPACTSGTAAQVGQ